MEISVEALRAQEKLNAKLTLNQLAEEIHQTSVAAGWYDPTKVRRPAEIHMLIVTEIAEATEEIRKGTPPVYVVNNGNVCAVESIQFQSLEMISFNADENKNIVTGYQKPEGELVELADAMIRILDYCGSKGWDVDAAVRLKMEYNKTRSQRHGGKLL